jgi:hypothetical protein
MRLGIWKADVVLVPDQQGKRTGQPIFEAVQIGLVAESRTSTTHLALVDSDRLVHAQTPPLRRRPSTDQGQRSDVNRPEAPKFAVRISRLMVSFSETLG